MYTRAVSTPATYVAEPRYVTRSENVPPAASDALLAKKVGAADDHARDLKAEATVPLTIFLPP